MRRALAQAVSRRRPSPSVRGLRVGGGLALALSLSLGAVGCQSCGGKAGSGEKAAREDLQLLPKDTNTLAQINVSRLRDTPLWRKLLDARDQSPDVKKKYDETAQKCGFDATKNLDSATIGLPVPTGNGEFAAILHGQFDEAKLVACVKDDLTKSGHSLVESDYNGKKLYNDPSSGGLYGAFLDGKTMVIGGPAWVKHIVDGAAGKLPAGEGSAKDNAPLQALVAKAKTGQAVWLVGIAPESARQRLKEIPQLADAASLQSLRASLDLANGLHLEVVLDLASDGDAKNLADKLTRQVADVKGNPKVMLLGLSPYLDQIKATSEGAAFQLTVNYNQQQTDELISRFEGLFKNPGSMFSIPGMTGAPSGATPSPDDATPPPGKGGMPNLQLKPPSLGGPSK